MIDLHTHSTASDGTLSPSELLACAGRKQLKAVALTDHDTVEGIDEALTAGRRQSVEVIPGVEISAESQEGTLHILGYYLDWKCPVFLKRIGVLQQAREERNPKIIEKLQKCGFSITMEEVAEEAKTGLVGRPHIAQVLYKKKHVRSPQQAFERYLKKGGSAYVEKFRFPPRDAIGFIRDAGGIPVLAHPGTLACSSQGQLEKTLNAMVGWGIMGIEVYYPDHSPAQCLLYKKCAEQFDLLITGGSDFHGHNLNGIDIGTGRGSLHVPYVVLEALKQAAHDRSDNA